MAGSVCVVTVHGIGFQQPPRRDGTGGYADLLHENLRAVLGDRLGDDPERRTTGGPVYVSSEWKGKPADGLARLSKPLIGEKGEIAHVALVYSPSEAVEPRFGETAEALARSAVSHARYDSALGALRLMMADAMASLRSASGGEAPSTLTPRTDLDFHPHHGLLARALHRGGAAAGGGANMGALGTLRALQDDVATYVARNDLRERVRDFVEAALLALVARDDVTAVVVNAHSQGTVLCWDVLCRLPFSSWSGAADSPATRFKHFVTAGSPIRKYVDMFAWGDEVGQLAAALPPSGVLRWHNFCDPADPVGDPLNPPATWRPGHAWEAPAAGHGLLVARDWVGGGVRHVEIEDVAVDNVANSAAGGLKAHDYWSNEKDFVPRLAALL